MQFLLQFLKPPRLSVLGVAAFLMVFLSACGAAPPGDSWANLSTDGQYVYVSWRDSVFRVNPSDTSSGTQRRIEWIAKLGNGSFVYAAPAFDAARTLYVGSFDRKIYAFPQNVAQPTPTALVSGEVAADRYIGQALYEDGILYIGNGNKGVKAVDIAGNRIKWNFDGTQYGVWATPIKIENRLYIASMDHNVYALDANTGKLITNRDGSPWKVNVGGAIGGTPLYEDGILYVGTFVNQLVAINLNRQEIVNRFPTQGWVWGTPVMFRDGDKRTLLFADLAGWVYAVDANSGREIWKARDESKPGGIRGKVGLARAKVRDEQTETDLVITGSENRFLRAYDLRDGKVKWDSAISAEDRILSDIIVLGNDAIFTTMSENQIVAAFDIRTGQLNWRVNLPEERTRLQNAPGIPLVVTPTTPTPAATQPR